MTRFGAACVPQVPPERIPGVARAAEAAGLDEMWLWEDCFWVSGTSGVVAALAATERITVAVGHGHRTGWRRRARGPSRR
jgi:alkanesulfonate monooxygenase SsuD/methylene tetrahydromethanopterin reductase-like flavin-dependent oxidoreductase (luciferase family)